MNKKTITKILASFLAFMIVFANMAFLGSSASASYAAEKTNLEGQATNIKNTEVEFDAYFQSERRNNA